MACECSSQNGILGLTIIVQLNKIHISSEHFITGIFSYVLSDFWHISHFGHISMLNLCTVQTQKAIEYPERWIPAIGVGILQISVLLEWQLWQSFAHPTGLTGPMFWVISMVPNYISHSVSFDMISAANPGSVPGSFSGWSNVPQKVQKILTMHGILQLELCYPHAWILTSLVLTWNGILLMDSSAYVTCIWLCGLGIITNISWLLKSHIAYTWWVKVLMVPRWGFQLVDL